MDLDVVTPGEARIGLDSGGCRIESWGEHGSSVAGAASTTVHVLQERASAAAVPAMRAAAPAPATHAQRTSS